MLACSFCRSSARTAQTMLHSMSTMPTRGRRGHGIGSRQTVPYLVIQCCDKRNLLTRDAALLGSGFRSVAKRACTPRHTQAHPADTRVLLKLQVVCIEVLLPMQSTPCLQMPVEFPTDLSCLRRHQCEPEHHHMSCSTRIFAAAVFARMRPTAN